MNAFHDSITNTTMHMLKYPSYLPSPNPRWRQIIKCHLNPAILERRPRTARTTTATIHLQPGIQPGRPCAGLGFALTGARGWEG